MSREDIIERWTTYIIPSVFRAEDALHSSCPEWKERIKNATDENIGQVAQDYCRAIAEIIVGTITDEELDGEK